MRRYNSKIRYTYSACIIGLILLVVLLARNPAMGFVMLFPAMFAFSAPVGLIPKTSSKNPIQVLGLSRLVIQGLLLVAVSFFLIITIAFDLIPVVFFTIFITDTIAYFSIILQIPPSTTALQHKQTTTKTQTASGITPLLQEVLSGKTEQVQAALAADPSQLNTPYAQNGNTPLHVAAWNGYKDIVELLLAQPGIDTQAKNLAGKTALDLAKEKNFTEIIEMLNFAEQK